ncbi:MAG: LysR substrate-binding domain-containing protein [Halofilum sp. (in: g-proteobacteria)]|nr:LysR substrate-binding domain-containing protein [Halofilum sp. (in: g-proteobacteria)]
MIPDIKLQQLRYFALVAELKSYHAAAERASRTQPAISLAIRELEHRLGEALFERGNKTELTPFGRHCYPQARALLEHYGRVVDQIAMAADKRTGQVAFACVPSFASQMLPRIMEVFARDHPDVEISVEDDTAYNVQQRVLQRRVDFGVASLWNRDPGLQFEPLMRDEMGLVCRRDHPLARAERALEWADLEGHALITNGTVRLLDGTHAQQVMSRARLSVSNVISLLAMLRAGLGITALPWLALDESDPDLCFLPLSGPTVERQLGVLTPTRHTLAPAARALRDCILAQPAMARDGADASVAEPGRGQIDAPRTVS